MSKKSKLLAADIDRRFAYEEHYAPLKRKNKQREKEDKRGSRSQSILTLALALFILSGLLYPLIKMLWP
ncbi:hypothetical protein L248_0820 [Schleiferilactobacillus shenzhenensis LY-73]|uniref:Uncharacterized protein n=2 Tax=Schleiferilactobacillus shenzhenensis TaxID=1231337 RepID=U4TM86_9LACO|nr:hypothetical protein L248_0820 [Schleiferilactobacillus shenzhenensis LY-73]